MQAAALDFAELGFERATVEGIARRAQTSVGSVYQFFPNKLSLFEAIGSSCIARSRELAEQLLSSATATPLLDLLDLAVDGFVLLNREDPEFRAMNHNLQHWGVHAQAENELIQELVRHTAALIGDRTRALEAELLDSIALMIVQSISSLTFFLALEEDDARSARMIEHTKIMLRRYVSPYLHDDASESCR